MLQGSDSLWIQGRIPQCRWILSVIITIFLQTPCGIVPAGASENQIQPFLKQEKEIFSYGKHAKPASNRAGV